VNLARLGPELDVKGPATWIIDSIIIIVVELRQAMHDRFGPDISTYAATIVRAMVSEAGGFVVHLGDGIGTAFTITKPNTLTIGAQSDPENGEYANQTFYVTEDNWLHHLRITPFGAAQSVLLATDGGEPLLYGKEGRDPAVDPSRASF
jgi:hypothetical protein